MEWTAEHLRKVQEVWYGDGIRYEIVLGYPAWEDPVGILDGRPTVHGEGKEWIVRS